MIEISKLKKSYGELEVLKGVDLLLKANEITAIVGASGAGKSTLLQLIGTLDRPNYGDINIEGISYNQLGNKKLAKFRNEQLGFVFQFHHLLPEFNAIENIMIPGLIAKKNKRDLKAAGLKWLDFLNLAHRANHKPSELSGGEQQRVAIARALINNPKLILADEPSGNLDSKNANELHQLFKQLRDEFHQTLVIVTHNESLAKESDRVVELKDGMVINDRYN